LFLQYDSTLQLDMDRKSVKVKIFGSEYPLRGESEEFTKKVAGYVDSMINSIHDKLPEQPPLTISVLAALNITEDLLKERDKNREALDTFEGEIMKIANYLDTSLQSSE
jgi:cell division protein ZapA (FtsZ GTPase activity inhibitor)